MSNTLTGLIPVLYEALDVVSRELVGIIPSVSRDSSAERAAKGQTVRSPVVPAVTLEDITPGATPADSGDASIGYVDMTITKAKAAPVRWTGEEQLSVKQSYREIQRDRFAQAMRALTNAVEKDLCDLYVNASRAYGTAGTAPFASDLKAMAQVRKILVDNGAPTGDLSCIIDTTAGANLRGLAALTNVNQAGTDRTLRDGVLLDLNGFAIRESAQVQIQDNSAESDAGTTTVNGAHLKGATTISIASATNGVTLIPGNFITILDHDYMMVQDAAVNISAGSSGDITIQAPGLMTDISDGEAVTQNTSNFTANMAFSRNAIHLITRAPALPEGGDAADDVIEIADVVSGLAFQVCMYRQYKRVKYEVGLAWGVKCVKPEHMALLLG